jgi:hypothetical protein
MGSDKPSGADNQQGSRGSNEPVHLPLTPQRLHAELLSTDAMGLEAYLQGALGDATRSARHRTHRIGQADPRWLTVLTEILRRLGYRGWIYREGRSRSFWILETTAPFLSLTYDASGLVGLPEGLCYARGYFDAEGGMPRSADARLYVQFGQKNRDSLDCLREILTSWGIDCGRVHNPSARVDPQYWRFYVRAASHRRFMASVGSWHPRKRQAIDLRMKI